MRKDFSSSWGCFCGLCHCCFLDVVLRLFLFNDGLVPMPPSLLLLGCARQPNDNPDVVEGWMHAVGYYSVAVVMAMAFVGKVSADAASISRERYQAS